MQQTRTMLRLLGWLLLALVARGHAAGHDEGEETFPGLQPSPADHQRFQQGNPQRTRRQTR